MKRTMKHTLFLVLFTFAFGFTLAQQNNGVRLGAGSSGKMFNPEITMISSSEIEITSEGEKISGLEIFDVEGNLIGSAAISNDTTSINIKGLQQGIYHVVAISETGQEQFNTFTKN